MHPNSRLLVLLATLNLAPSCGANPAPDDGGTIVDTAPPPRDGAIECCPRSGGVGQSCAGGGSRRLRGGTCAVACDCLHVTGVARDADGCEFDVYVDHFPNCG